MTHIIANLSVMTLFLSRTLKCYTGNELCAATRPLSASMKMILHQLVLFDERLSWWYENEALSHLSSTLYKFCVVSVAESFWTAMTY